MNSLSRTSSNPPLYLRQIELGPLQNFVYLIGCPVKKVCAVVDPAWDFGKVFVQAKIDGMKVTSAFITHTHFDHINAVHDFLGRTDGRIYLNKNEAEFLKVSKTNLHPTEAGEAIKIGDLEVTFLHTPGHTPGSQCFYVGGNLVSGDTLFINACGRTDLPGGDTEELYRSLTRLAELPEDTTLYPGHNYSDRPSSTIGDEKRQNPFLQIGSLEEFLWRVRGF